MDKLLDHFASKVTLDPRWAKLLARDASADGEFFYAVSSTGIYCYPSCAARTPRPQNVRFIRMLTMPNAQVFVHANVADRISDCLHNARRR